MIYFIPAWYRQNQWKETEQIWYTRRQVSEFDETVKQVQLFHRNNFENHCIMLLSHSPNFRHFLHRQGIFTERYWSCFDAIQCVKRNKASVFSFHDLKWPEHTEFIYSAFSVVAFVNGKKYAQVEFGEDGNTIQVDIYKAGVLHRKNYYDDRGFVSSSILYENNIPQYEQFLDESGAWKICQYFSDGHVVINPKNRNYLVSSEEQGKTADFNKLTYQGMNEVVEEVVSSFLSCNSKAEDIFFAAAHALHAEVLSRLLKGRKYIVTAFRSRMDCFDDKNVRALIRGAGLVVADSLSDKERLTACVDMDEAKLIHITPYDSRVDFGISLQLQVQNILIPVDGLSGDLFRALIISCCEYMKGNKDARVHLFTRRAEYGIAERILAEIDNIISSKKEDDLDSNNDDIFSDSPAESIGENKELFVVDQCVDELQVSRCMKLQKVMVDLSPIPDMFLQIACLSMGIPQIVKTPTEYVSSGKNGKVVSSMEETIEAVSYYLDSVVHWNEAKISSYEMGKGFSTPELVRKWKEAVEKVGKD